MYNKLEEQEYASMVQKYRSEYGGRYLRGFCLEIKYIYHIFLIFKTLKFGYVRKSHLFIA